MIQEAEAVIGEKTSMKIKSNELRRWPPKNSFSFYGLIDLLIFWGGLSLHDKAHELFTAMKLFEFAPLDGSNTKTPTSMNLRREITVVAPD